MAHHTDNPDFHLALLLQSEYDREIGVPIPKRLPGLKRNKSPIEFRENGPTPAKKYQSKSLIDPELEIHDPTPDIHTLFMKFDRTFFWSTLAAVEVRWSPRMYSCAGICSYEGRRGLCSIRLSEPLLKLRPRKDLIETLLHEMIHAYLFVTDNNKDRDGHGPEFKRHMFRINTAAGTNITIYHSFHNEVKLYQKHWWRCDGACRNRPPFFGMIKRSMNRKPGPSDFWWTTHQATCGGNFIKVREPEAKANKTKTKSENMPKKVDIRKFFDNSTSRLPSNIVSVSDLKKNVGSTVGAKKKIPVNSSSVISRKEINGTTSTNRVVGFSDLLNQNTNVTKKNIFGGEGKKLGTGALKKKYNSGGSAVMNKGTGTLTVTSKFSDTAISKAKIETKTSRNFVPFGDSGHRLGGSDNVTHRNSNHRCISSLVYSLQQPKSNNKPITVPSEKYKDDFLNITISDDELAGVDEVGYQTNSNSSKSEVRSSKKYENDFLNTSVSDDELAGIEEPPKGQNQFNKTSEYSPEKYKEDFLGKSNSDDDLNELDINLDVFENDNNDIVPCPVCNLKLLRDDMSIHLESCDILNSTIKSMNNTNILEGISDDEECSDTNSNNNLTQPNSNLLPCPCCSNYVNEGDINKHLDECLSLLAIKEFDKEF